MWQNRSFTCTLTFMLTLCHHKDGYVHSSIAEKPKYETGSVLTN